MNRRHLFQLLAVTPFAMSLRLADAAPPTRPHPQRRWTVINRRSIASTSELVSFIHRAGIPSVRTLKIAADGHAVWLNAVKVTYRDGSSQSHRINLNIPAGSSSPGFDLVHDSGMVRRVDISFSTLPLTGRHGEILLWGGPVHALNSARTN